MEKVESGSKICRIRIQLRRKPRLAGDLDLEEEDSITFWVIIFKNFVLSQRHFVCFEMAWCGAVPLSISNLLFVVEKGGLTLALV
jgi:hypothetical protein